ncbi:MAG: P-loop NTPase [Elusimicrobiota bacterium]
MKIAISGKGGAGKTTVAAFLAHSFLKENKKVFLIDADPDGNLPLALGFTPEELSKIKPIIELKELIAERTGSTGDGYFKLNPDVSDIPEKYSFEKNGIKIMVLGTLKRGGSGCYCPENAFLKSLLRHLFLRKEEVIILDMPAGIEHLGRGTAETVDCLLIVAEPTSKSVQTAQRVSALSKDLKIKKVYVVGNKITGKSDVDFIKNEMPDIQIIGNISYNPGILKSEQSKKPLFLSEGITPAEITEIKNRL